MDDQLEFQDSVFWTPQILNDVQDLVEEEALFYKPTLKSDRWDHLTMDGCRWLVRYHGGARVQRFHPEHRSCPEEIENLEFMRITIAWKGTEWHRRVIVDRPRIVGRIFAVFDPKRITADVSDQQWSGGVRILKQNAQNEKRTTRYTRPQA